LNSGVWPFIRQRPYGTIANRAKAQSHLHICLDDPLAPDTDFIMSGKESYFQTELMPCSN
jgi:Na+-transporting NADH:ubiquinone oxidoreductase subunit A